MISIIPVADKQDVGTASSMAAVENINSQTKKTSMTRQERELRQVLKPPEVVLITTHTGQTFYQCAVCKKAFQNKEAWHQHETLHIKKPFKCSQCDRTFKTESDRDIHLLTALFTKPPDGLPPYRTGSGGRSVRQFPIDFFPFCRERPVTKEPAAL